MIYSKFFKRIFDILAALIFFPVVFLIVLIAGLFINFNDRGPIFYCSNRIGQFGKSFRMYKLRTMYVNAPDIRLEDGSTFNSIDDVRLTSVGKTLRKYSIDELPQILNVLTGEMSIVGPRPDPIDWLDKYSSEVIYFLNVKPGLTGYNQAFFRNSVDGKAKMVNDLFYAQNISFKLDLLIVFQTIITVTFARNLYIDKSRK